MGDGFQIEGSLGRARDLVFDVEQNHLYIVTSVGTTSGTILGFDYVPLSPPSITIEPESLTLAETSSGLFEIEVSGTEPLNFQWVKDGDTVVDATNSVYEITSATEADAGEYYCVVSNAVGVATSQTAIVSIVPPDPPAILSQPSSVLLLAGDPAVLAITVSGPQPAYQWQKDNEPISGATGSLLNFSPIELTDAGHYFCVVTNPFGQAVSATASVSVASNPLSTTVPVGGAAEFSVEYAGEPEPSLQWLHNGAPLPGGSNSILTIPEIGHDAVGGYACVVENVHGVVTTTVAVLTVQDMPEVVSQPLSRIVRYGQPVTLEAEVAFGPDHMIWRKGEADLLYETNSVLHIASADWTHAGAYRLVASNAFGVVTSEVARIAVATDPAPTFALAGLEARMEVRVDGPEPLSFQWRHDGAPVPGATSRVFRINESALSDAGGYSCVVAGYGTAWTSSVAQLSIGARPTVEVTPEEQVVVQGSTLVFEAVANGTPPLTYRWERDGALVAGSTNGPNLEIANAQYHHSGFYRCVVSNRHGWAMSDASQVLVTNPPPSTPPTVIVWSPPSYAFLHEHVSTVQAGDSFSLTLGWAGGQGQMTFAWRHNGQLIEGATNRTLTLLNVTEADAGHYEGIVGGKSADTWLTVEPAGIRFVSPDGDHHAPYSTWAAAATNIQTAINAAVDGDLILVSPGMYRERINFNGKAITIRSLDPPDPAVRAETIIDGGGEGPVVLFSSSETTNSVLAGFTITGGNNPGQSGGGIRAVNTASPRIEHNLIVSNSAQWGGGFASVFAGASTPVIVNNVFEQNSAVGGSGGAVYLQNEAHAIITGNVIRANSARFGGGIAAQTDSVPEIRGNVVEGNTALDQGGGIRLTGGTVWDSSIVSNWAGNQGGGVYLSGASEIHDSLISQNVSTNWGGGAYVRDDAKMFDCVVASNSSVFAGGAIAINNARIHGSSFVANTAYQSGGLQIEGSAMVMNSRFEGNTAQNHGGGGLFLYGGLARNVLVISNSAVWGGGVSLQSDGQLANATVVGNSGGGVYNFDNAAIHNSIVYSNMDYEYSGETQSLFSYSCTYPLPAGAGNFTNDPQFVNAALGDYRPAPGSPLINAGTNAAWMSGATDLRGVPRIQGDVVDVGAYEVAELDVLVVTTELEGAAAVGVTFTAHHIGLNTSAGLNFRWQSSEFDHSGPTFTNFAHTFGAGTFPVTLTVTNSAGESFSWAGTVKRHGPWTVNPSSSEPHLQTIQAAVDAAWPGMTILVPPGIYASDERSGYRLYVDKTLTIRSTHGPEQTILRGNLPSHDEPISVVYMGSSNTVLSGFTIEGGVGNAGGGVLGGTVTNCIVRGNVANSGGGVANSIVRNSRIVNNKATFRGGGAHQSAIFNSVIEGNEAQYGGGVYNTTVDRSSMRLNVAEWNGGGVGGSDSRITLSDISFNRARHGGGIDGGYAQRCVIEGNYAEHSGGALSSAWPVFNCLIIYNEAGVSHGVGIDPMLSTIYGNRAPTFAGVKSTGQWSDPYNHNNLSWGNVATDPNGDPRNSVDYDPRFVSVEDRNFRLRPDSPAINAGDPAFSNDWGTDYDGTARVKLGRVDLGAFEASVGSATLHVRPNGASVPPYASSQNAATNLNMAIQSANIGDTILVHPGTYTTGSASTPQGIARVHVNKAVTLRSVSGPATTIIEGNSDMRGVYLAPGARLSGFTVRNGQAALGGGIYSQNGHVDNCIVYSNIATEVGGGIWGGQLRQTLVYDNLAEQSGGGVAHASLNLCTVSENEAIMSGGGVYTSVVHNTVVWGNHAPGITSNHTESVFSYSLTAPLPSGTRNLDGDPLFKDVADRNFRLTPNSPAIDCGLNSVSMWTEKDMDGKPRIIHATVDMGVYESGYSIDLYSGAAHYPHSETRWYRDSFLLQLTPDYPHIDMGTTQVVVGGWSGTGAVTPGTGDVAVLPLTDYSTLTWQWKTQYWAKVEAVPPDMGFVTGGNTGWYDAGEELELTAVPEPHHTFVHWVIDGVPEETNNVPFTMYGSREAIAHFYELVTSQGVPHWWLAQFGAEASDDGAEALAAGNYRYWEHYVAGTDPHDETGYLLVLTDADDIQETGIRVRWRSVEGRTYDIHRSTHLPDGFQPLATDIPGQSGHTTHTDETATTPGLYIYRIRVRP